MKIKETDFLSHKVSLTINDKGDTAYKTFIGGIISILTVLLSIICCSYFLIRMFKREDLSLIVSSQIDYYVNITDSHKLPFLFRLTDTNSIPYEEDEKLYYMTMSVWFGGSNDSSLAPTATQYRHALNVSKCNLDIHFDSKFKELFKDIENLNTYYCIEPRNYSQTIYGFYGSYYPFSYYSFTMRYCSNTTQNNNSCYSISEIKEKFATPYLDLIFLDYTINSLNTKNVEQVSIRKERFELSAKLYKRIYLYLENIKYITDTGYIFTNNKMNSFYKYISSKVDTNVYDTPVIATLSVMNSINSSTYHRKYTKFQDYLATIGGIIKVISLLGNGLNYFNAENSYYLKIIKDFVFKNNLHKIEKKKSNSKIIFKSKLNFPNSLIDYSKGEMSLNNNSNYDYNIQKKNNTEKFKKILSHKILPPLLLNNKEKYILKIYKQFVNKRLNLISILKKLETITDFQEKKDYSSSINEEHGIKLVQKKNNNFILEHNIT